MEDTEKELKPEIIFAPEGSKIVLDDMRDKASKFIGDATTPAGRKDIASFAYKIAKEKTRIDGLGEAYASDLKTKVKIIDVERKKIRDGLDVLKDEVRKPVTDFEEREKNRISTIESHLADLAAISDFLTIQSSSIDDLRARINRLEMFNFNEWGEFQAKADVVKVDGIKLLQETLDAAIKREADRVELERLRAAEAERAKKEHDERVAAESAAKAKKEAEAKAAAEAQAAAEKAAAEKAAIEAAAAKAKADAEASEARARAAEAARVAAEDKAKADAIAAAKATEAAKQKAIEDERQRVAAAEKAAAEAEAKRKADTSHRAEINNGAVAALVEAGLSVDDAKKAVVAIAKGNVPNITIRY